MPRESGCVFCEIVHGEREASIIHQDDLVTAFLDANPVNPGHTLVVPNDHADSIQDVPEEACSRMLTVGRDLDKALRASGLRCDAVNLFLADGQAAGQTVFHAHLHVIPRYSGDTCGLHLHSQAPEAPLRKALDEHAQKLAAAFQETWKRKPFKGA